MIADALPVQPSATHEEWLKSTVSGDLVLVRNGLIHMRAQVTDDTPRYLFVGKLKFKRSDGWQTKRQQQQAYRMKLRLVRSEHE